MSLYVYAIADGVVLLDDLRGVAGEPLRVVTSGDGHAHAIAGDFTVAGADAGAGANTDADAAAKAHADANASADANERANPPVLSAETLRAQDALVRELAQRISTGTGMDTGSGTGALLPARFGARFADERALRQTLDELSPRLDRALTRVRGREQMTIRLFHEGAASAESPGALGNASDTSPAINPSRAGGTHDTGDASSATNASDAVTLGPGTRYMRQRAAAGRVFPEAVEELRAALADAIDDERVERGQSPVIGSIHHLIPRGSAAGYRARLDEAAASPRFAASGIRLRVSGPSPAYAFAEADLS